jgi:hypothetical protein
MQDDAVVIPCGGLLLLGVFVIITLAGEWSWWATVLAALGYLAMVEGVRRWFC